MSEEYKNKEVQIDKIIHGRIEPQIYAFYTEKVPNFLKVGDTYRGVDVRISEWEKKIGPVNKIFEHDAKVNDDVYFRDYEVHKYLISHSHPRIKKEEIDGELLSTEFFKNATKTDIEDGINDIVSNYNNGSSPYEYYDISNKTSLETSYERNQDWPLRKNQCDVVDNFVDALKKAEQRKTKQINLLMYAVMRFGKSYTALHCAKAMKAKFVIVVSAKADVQTEWKRNVQCPKELEGFVFADDEALKKHSSDNYIEEQLKKSECLVLVLTLQTLAGEKMKGRHKQIFNHPCDLLIVDETHYGAWADKYGAVININQETKAENKKSADDDFVDVNNELIKKIKRKVTLHLSGTPYRLLKEKEFRREQLISYCSMADIAKAQKEWYETFEQGENPSEEWQNPYFGFPEMIRFGFDLNKTSKEKLKELNEQGIATNLSTLFTPNSLKKDDAGKYKTFYFESQVLDLLKIIDGSKTEEGILSFLDLKEIKKGKMCEHIVMVLPYCASCDAMEKLLKNNKNIFKNLKCDDNYKIINISGLDGKQNYKKPEDVIKVLEEAERNNQKTITLTVNRMLTGSTVKQWDTMIYLKSSSSAQEYDQATFRIQSQNIETIKQDNKTIKICKKPQTLLIDFELNRLFIMQAQKSSFYDFRNQDGKGNSEIGKRIDEELNCSPILVMNGNRIEKVDGIDVLKAVSDYHANIGIKEEATTLPVDFDLIKSSKKFREAMENENMIGSNKGFRIEKEDGTTNIDGSSGGDGGGETKTEKTTKSKEEEKKTEESALKKKVQNHYARILAFAFVCDKKIISLKEVIDCFKDKMLSTTLNNLGLDKNILSIMQNDMSDYILSKLDYSIQDMSELSHNSEKLPEDIALIAVKKFNAFGSNEISTSESICSEMINTISDEELVSMIKNNAKILDINSKVGEFAIALNKKAKYLSNLYNEELNISSCVYSIASSLFTKEIVKKVYGLIGFDLKNIAGFTSDELTRKIKSIRNKKKRDCFLEKLLEQDCDFCDIHIQ